MRYLIPLLAFLGTYSAGQAQAAAPLTPQARATLTALARHDYAQARQLAAQMQPTEAIRALTPAAARNNTNAQWLVAQAWSRRGDARTAAHWAYTARMGTQLDAAICQARNVRETAGLLVEPYSSMLDEVRRDPIIEQSALRFAGHHYAKNWKQYQDPAWACRTWQVMARREPRFADTIPVKRWTEIRRMETESLLRKSGMGNLVPSKAEGPSDPQRQNFGIQEDFGSAP